MQDFEKLGMFYLGKGYDLETRKPRPDLLLYDAKDLTTHAVCVGMTGSGKTGLCLALLEEAAIDGIPAIVIDPKGDLANLLLTFPELQPSDFRPWVDEAEAQRRGISPEQLADQTAKEWRDGLAEWGQTPDRIAKFRDAADAAIYTPGSSAGLPLTVLRSFGAPAAELLQDADALRERISAAVSGLLALLGVDVDPLRSREHILLSRLVELEWRAGRDLYLEAMVRDIQSPPFATIGVMDLESIFPAKERFGLAMSLNNLLASPASSATSLPLRRPGPEVGPETTGPTAANANPPVALAVPRSMVSATIEEPLSTQLSRRRASARRPLPVNCLKPKVFLGRRSIRQIRGSRKNFAAARAVARAEFACAKG
jgi:hypothetical protein